MVQGMSQWMRPFSRFAANSGGRPPPASGEADVAHLGPSDLSALFEANAEFVWRLLRRLGVPEASTDDATQEVFVVAQRKISSIVVGRERAFLFSVSMNVASHARRAATRRREVGAEEAEEVEDPAPLQDAALDRQRARALLDEVLDAMADDTRAAFVLSEMEDMKMADIAALLGIPQGTVASRLRRAREEFHEHAKRVRARVERRVIPPSSARSSNVLLAAAPANREGQ
jgi:RNA polymerase sigma-70 factor (ECF subfamily)